MSSRYCEGFDYATSQERHRKSDVNCGCAGEQRLHSTILGVRGVIGVPSPVPFRWLLDLQGRAFLSRTQPEKDFAAFSENAPLGLREFDQSPLWILRVAM